ncbi:DMT family transporter [Microvirga terrae]|uniref:DMT family transporter n=1 Tax=Microvirga terrae TaxID=2740529 RepID=A0ABY5RWF4_9HYPH|nr:DMT family transporter [Microvirga terrae]UVF20122.1 DMT family transporter [Microvirga terrae]
MSPDVFAFVLVAAFLHASWNAMAKSGKGDPLIQAGRIAVGSAVAAVPALLVSGLPDAASSVHLVGSALIHVAYFVLIGLAYRYADYSAIYPLVRGSAPLFTTLLAMLLLGETLKPVTWLGIGILCGGILGLGIDAVRRGGLNVRSLTIAALTAATVVGYTLVDGVGARLSGNSTGYLLAMMALTGAFMIFGMIRFQGAALFSAPASVWGKSVAAGAIANISYGTALWAMTKAPIGLVGAVRETSVLFAALIAAVVLKERFGIARWASALMIVTGLALAKAG